MFVKALTALVCSGTLCLALGVPDAAASGPGCPGVGSTYAPPAGQTILTVGQDKAAIDAYTAGTGDSPGGTMVYSTLAAPAAGLLVPYANIGSGEQDMQHLLATYPYATVNVGLHMVDQLDAINLGAYDANIIQLAEILRGADRPVYLRIGYEVDGPWNHHEPGPFVLAWKRIVDGIRARGVTNVSFVWHSGTSYWGRYGGYPLSAWYPGECYVDWVGASVFDQPRYGAAGWAPIHELVDFGRQHGHPVMISESTPLGRFTPSTDAQVLWDDWYGPIFDFIEAGDVQLFSYINVNWEALGNWAGWGDSRVQENESLEAMWLAKTGEAKFLHGTDHLYADLGYTQTGDGLVPNPTDPPFPAVPELAWLPLAPLTGLGLAASALRRRSDKRTV